MKIIYAQEELEKSIFLVGPTQRNKNVKSWRPEALKILEPIFDGTVLVPEPRDTIVKDSYIDQVHWEWEGLNTATVVACWVPRDLATLPGFITNIEFGMLANSGKLVLGAPKDAHKMGYMKMLATRFNIPFYETLEDTMKAAVVKSMMSFGSNLKC